MCPSLIGVARINLEEVTSVVQMGQNITDGEPIHFVVVGKRLDGKQSVVIVKVDASLDISVVANTDLSNSIIDTLRSVGENDTIAKLVCSQASE